MKKDAGVRPDRTSNIELNQELKTRARRRLMGAVTLVLTAIIVVPMLLDSEPRPLSQNISIEIPEKNTPFTPRLEPAKSAVTASAASASAASEGAAAEPPQVQTNDATHVPASTDNQASASAANQAAAAKAGSSAAGKYLIQVAAYSKEEQAQEWVKKLKAAGFQAYTEKVTTSSGARVRVRVGPYAQQSDADKALALIKAQGASEARLVN